MRVIAGTLKGRKLEPPSWDGLRPTSDKLRETLFNVLGPSISGARVLDAFAGTGAVGIEAISRGASHVTFIEQDRRAADLIATNLSRCGVKTGYAIIRVDFARAVTQLAGEPFEIMFLDPPYGATAMTQALESATRIAEAGSYVVIEHAKRDAPPPKVGGLVLARQLKSGDSGLAFYAADTTAVIQN
jgi:16S rRNA (guanine(966)-N(2))-methyltransferase RsmD